MAGMTPEERWTRIENAMQFLMENQERHEAEIAKNAAAIRDLIVLSRTFLDSQKELTAQVQSHDLEIRAHRESFLKGMEELREVQKTTAEKLHALIETVDRIIKDSRDRNI